jgi:hypothetical protein
MEAVSDDTDDQLLVRDAAPQDRGAVIGLLAGAGWETSQLDAWAAGAPAVVLYDPASDVIYGAAAISALAEGTFALVGWAVRGVTDAAAATARVVRAVADQARRAGGERLVAVDPAGSEIHSLVAAGFAVVDRGATHRTGPMTLYQEL